VRIVSLMFIFFINYYVVDTIECLNLFYMPMQNNDEVLRGHTILDMSYLDPTMITEVLVRKQVVSSLI
jgi:hypothetical protein